MIILYRISIITSIFFTLLLWPSDKVLFAADWPSSSTDVTTPNKSPQVYKATVYQWDGDCYHLYSGQALIEAQAGVGDTDSAWTGRCADGYVGMEGYAWLRVRERFEAQGGGGASFDVRFVLRAISSQNAILCCPIRYEWKPPP